MRRTTPLAHRMHVRAVLVFAILLLTSACGSKQYTSKQPPMDSPASLDTLADFQPYSPFQRLSAPAQYCSLNIQNETLVAKNPFRASSMMLSGPMTQRLTSLAFSQIGTLYRPGGAEPATGFDCSGFTTWVYSKLGINLPRSSREQFLEGHVVDKAQLRKGDLVFFGNKKRITHVGIYLENNKFIHSSSSGDTVKISSLDDPAWVRKYSGARRVF
ncbi:hypothetical protein JCM15519_35520 [Fundidesulfovibrio butyratiphilus]